MGRPTSTLSERRSAAASCLPSRLPPETRCWSPSAPTTASLGVASGLPTSSMTTPTPQPPLPQPPHLSLPPHLLLPPPLLLPQLLSLHHYCCPYHDRHPVRWHLWG